MTTIEINGERRTSRADLMTPLLDVLRDEFFLTGAKPVCREGICGACTVLVDGLPTMSCLVPVGTLEGRSVLTIEGLADAGEPNAIQAVFEQHDVVQCGMCFPGMVVTLTRFLEHVPNPSRNDVKDALVGNICRCTGYERLIDAALDLAGRGAERAAR